MAAGRSPSLSTGEARRPCNPCRIRKTEPSGATNGMAQRTDTAEPDNGGVVVKLPIEWSFDACPALTRFWDDATAAAPNLFNRSHA